MRDLKHVLLSLTILIIHNVNAQGAKVTKSQPPKKATRIIVLTKDSANTLLDRIAVTLFDMGYIFETKDEKLKILSTKERASKRFNILTKIQARINDTAIVFTSTMALGFEMRILGVTHTDKYDPVSYTGMKGSAMREAWNELQEIARLFGDKIVYSK